MDHTVFPRYTRFLVGLARKPLELFVDLRDCELRRSLLQVVELPSTKTACNEGKLYTVSLGSNRMKWN